MPDLHLTPIALILIQLAAILLSARALGFFVGRLGQPLVIAEILAGILLGPSLLGWLAPGVMHGLFPASSFAGLQLLSQVGLVLFMFLVGLELDPALLVGQTKSSIGISWASIVVPALLGAGAATLLHARYAPAGVELLPFALFMGAAMSVTAFPVLARILSERNLRHTRVGAIALACAAVDDVTAWCMLALVVGVARAEGVEHALWTTGLSLGFILVMVFVVRPFLGRLSRRISGGAPTPGVLAIVFFFLLVSATITELIGIHALFGAFLFGAILPKQGAMAHALAERIEAVAVVLLMPLFFAYSGLRTQLGLVSTGTDWLVCFALIGLATVGKFGGSAIAARLTGLGWREASAIGILMNTRGLMELIVLNVGLDLGVISPSIFTMLVIMALVTTVATTPLLRRIYRRLDEGAPRAPRGAGEAPAGVLVCVADGAAGVGLLTVAGALREAPGAPPRLLALHLQRATDRPSLPTEAPDAPGSPLAPLLARAAERSLAVEPRTFVSSDVPGDLCRAAVQHGVGLILLGAHRPLLLEGDLGGTVGGVIARADRPVAVLVDRGLARLARVLVIDAGGAEDRAPLEVARRLALEPGVAVTTLRVAEHAAPEDAVLGAATEGGHDLLVIGMIPGWGSGRRRKILETFPISILAVTAPKA